MLISNIFLRIKNSKYIMCNYICNYIFSTAFGKKQILVLTIEGMTTSLNSKK